MQGTRGLIFSEVQFFPGGRGGGGGGGAAAPLAPPPGYVPVMQTSKQFNYCKIREKFIICFGWDVQFVQESRDIERASLLIVNLIYVLILYLPNFIF